MARLPPLEWVARAGAEAGAGVGAKAEAGAEAGAGVCAEAGAGLACAAGAAASGLPAAASVHVGVPVLLFLGTGASSPSKYRNVTGMYLRLPQQSLPQGNVPRRLLQGAL